MKRVYVAGSFSNRGYIKKKWITPLSKQFTITHDWTSSECGERSPLQNQKFALSDYEGVKTADFIVVIMNKRQSLKHAYRGTFFEMGVAYGLKKPIYVFYPFKKDIEQDIFLELPNIEIFKSSSLLFHLLSKL